MTILLRTDFQEKKKWGEKFHICFMSLQTIEKSQMLSDYRMVGFWYLWSLGKYLIMGRI